jgi:hypothetical protein
MFVPDTHAVVPKEPTDAYWLACPYSMIGMADENYELVIKTAPQLTTPPVLRWEKNHDDASGLLVGNKVIAVSARGINGRWANLISGTGPSKIFDTEQEARRAAEAALGLPIVEDV